MTEAMGPGAAWAAVEALARSPRPDGSAAHSIRPLFAADPDRFRRFSRSVDRLLLDLSKTALTDQVLAALLALTEAAGLAGKRDAMARGEAVNTTERRAVLHMALRAPREAGFKAGTEDASAEVAAVLDRMREFCAAVHGGMARGAPPLGAPAGAAGQRFTDVVNIGIGGGLDVMFRRGIVVGSVATENARVAETLAVTREEWARMAKDGPTEAERADAVAYMTGSLPLQFTDSRRVADSLLSLRQNGRPMDWLAGRAARLQALPTERLAKVAARLLRPEALAVVVAGQPVGL